MTQTDRVLAALTRAGARGITSVDFIRTPTVDGGAPILRVAARIRDLRDQGFDVETDGERDGVAVYKLRASDSVAQVGTVGASGSEAATPPEPSGTLFEIPSGRATSHWKAA